MRRPFIVRSLSVGCLSAVLVLSGMSASAAPADPIAAPQARSNAANPHGIVSDAGETLAAARESNEAARELRKGLSTSFEGSDQQRELAGKPLQANKESLGNNPAAYPDPAQERSAKPNDRLNEGEFPGDEGADESIIGVDNRFPMYATTTYPYRAITLITGVMGGSSYRCTGWFISKDTVVTAGHCVYGGVWATNVRVYPGYTGAYAPYGSCAARRLYSVAGWVPSRDPEYDYGVIKLSCTIGDTVGWFGFRWTAATLTGQGTAIIGYPGDKPYTLWGSIDSVRYSGVRQLFYANDTTGGMSGSPVYNGNAGCYPCGIAIHTQGLYGGSPYNRGTRITQQVFNNLVYWKNLP